jgi:Tfp pilus assembly protein PilN
LSRKSGASYPIIEWSPSAVVLHDESTNLHTRGESIQDVASQVRGSEVIVALSRRSSFVKTVRLPDAAKADVAKVLAVQIGQIFPMGPGELAFDFRMTPDVNSEGRLCVVVGVRSEMLRQIHADLKTAGLKAAVVVPVSTGSMLLAQEVGQSNCAVVERTEEGLAVDIVHEGELRYSRVAPFPRDAADLEAEVCRTFTAAKLPCAAAVAVGGLTYDGATLTVKEHPAAYLSTLATALDLNLELPEVAARRAKQRVQRRSRLALLLTAIAIAGSVFTYLDRAAAAATVREENQEFQRRIRTISAARATVNNQITEAQNMNALLHRAFEPPQPARDIMAIATQQAPNEVWLTGMTFERGKPLLIRGTALNSPAISQYLDRLAQFRDPISGEARLRDVQLMFANNTTVEETTVVLFSIQAHVIGNLPLIEQTRPGQRGAAATAANAGTGAAPATTTGGGR